MANFYVEKLKEDGIVILKSAFSEELADKVLSDFEEWSSKKENNFEKWISKFGNKKNNRTKKAKKKVFIKKTFFNEIDCIYII